MPSKAPARASKPAGGRGRSWLIGIGSFLVLFTGAYLLFQNKIVDAELRPVIERELAKAVNSPVSIQSVRAGLTGDVVLNQVVLTVPGNPWETHVEVEQVSVNVELMSLLFHRKPLEDCLEGLSFVKPKISLVRNPAAQTTASAVPGPSAPAPPTQVPIPLFPVPEVSIQKGVFSVQAEKTPQDILTDLNFTASTRDKSTWGLRFQASSPEQSSMGSLRFNGSLHMGDLKVSGKVLLEKWPLTSIQRLLKELAGWELLGGTINAESPVLFEPSRGLWYDAKADLSQAVIRSPSPTSITLSQISGRAFIRPSGISVPGNILFSLGETIWNATGEIPFDNRPLAVKTTTDRLFLSSVFGEILKLKTLKVDGQGNATLVVAGPMNKPVIQGAAVLGPSHVGQGSLDSLLVRAGYEKGNLRLYEAKGALYDGEFHADGFISLSGEKDAPVSLKAVLKNVEAKKLASDYGIAGMEGRINQDIRIRGSPARLILSAVGDMELSRALGSTQVQYSIHNKLQLVPQKLEFSAVINDKAHLEGEFDEKPDAWEIKKLFLTTGKKKGGRLTGRGAWPKNDTDPIDIRMTGEGIFLQDLPFLNDQFPDITGNLSIGGKLGGTRKELTTAWTVRSDAVSLKGLESPEPLDVSISWKGGELNFEKFSLGEKFSTSGKLGFQSESPLDLQVGAQGFPVKTIAELFGWNNPPDPFEGNLTGKLNLSGTRKNPVISGKEGITLTSFKMGDWTADQVEALLTLDDGKLMIKKLKLMQGDHFLTATGSWDSRPRPGIMALRFDAKDFQLGKGPYLSGQFHWDAKTKDLWDYKNWDGTFASDSIQIKDLKNNVRRFDDFSMVATSENLVIKGKVKIGKNIAGSATFDLASKPSKVQALLKVEPVLLSQASEIAQFLPSALKAKGEISGLLRLKEGEVGEFPLTGNFTVTDGSVQNYDFDQMEFNCDGLRPKVAVAVSIIRDKSKFKLSGTIESPKSFWDTDSKIDVNGPIQDVQFQNILTLLGINTEKHHISGIVNGNLSITGSLYNPNFEFTVTGDSLRFDNNLVPKAELNFSYFDGKILMGKNQVTLAKGQINVSKGSAQLDLHDPTLVNLDLSGSTQNVPIASVFDLTSQIHLAGSLALEEKESRPTFDGMLSILESAHAEKNSSPFDLSIRVHKKTIEFQPLDNGKTQLVGKLDFSQDKKIIFENIHLEHSQGLFSVDGTLDLEGNSHFVSDAKNIPIQEVGKWVLPKFPLSGTGNYHLIFDGTLDSPVFTTSISVANGKIGDLGFDLLNGELKAADGTLDLGTQESPLVLSRKNLYSFNIWGKSPIALTKTGWVKVRDREMDINAQMDQGDFSLILLAGLAKKASGEMDFSAHVGGTLDNPILTMDLDLNQCQMVPTLVAQSIEDISGRIKVRNNRLAVEDLNGRIGQGRVFISTPPIEESKIVLNNFIPSYLDFRVLTVGDHGLLLSIPTLMSKGEWGEIYFFGDTPKDPMVIQGTLEEPKVIGTALLDTGHYKFPPEEAVDEKGEKIEYRELAGVTFELKLLSGKNTWYSNEFNTQYLDLKVDPGDEIMITGKDKDRTPTEAGIKCYGSATSKEGRLRYLGHEFRLQDGSINISKGVPPVIQGTATDRFTDVLVASAGGSRKTDVDVYLHFKGTFGKIDFTLESSPRFSINPDDAQKILYSYVMFGQDFTGLTLGNPTNYTPQQLQALYQQRVGPAIGQAASDTLNRIFSNFATSQVRSIAPKLLGPAEINIKTNLPVNEVFGTSPVATPGVNPSVDPTGNSLAGITNELLDLEVKRYVTNKLFVGGSVGVNRNTINDQLGVQGNVKAGYELDKNLSLELQAGKNESGQDEARGIVSKRWELPNIPNLQPNDKTKPKFLRFDAYQLIPGKYQLVWELDKYSQCVIEVLDTGDKTVKRFVKKDFDYDHSLVVDGLDPALDYKFQITATDTNHNQAVTVRDVSGTSEE